MPEKCLLPKPATLTWKQAANILVAYLSAWRKLFGKNPLLPSKTVLIIGLRGDTHKSLRLTE